MERRSTFSLLAATVAQMVTVADFLWMGVALFGGNQYTERFCQISPQYLIGAVVLSFVITHLLLQQGRMALLIVLVNLAFDGLTLLAIRCYFNVDEPTFFVLWAVMLVLVQFFQIKWEIGRFQDSTIMLIMQVLFVMVISQIWAGEQLEMSSPWLSWSYGAILVLLLGALTSKLTGLEAGGRAGRGREAKVGLMAAVGAIVGVATGLVGWLVKPVGNGIILIYQYTKGILAAACTIIGKIIKMLLAGGSSSIQSETSVTNASDEVEILENIGAGFDGNIFRIIFEGVMLLLAIAALICVVRLLMTMTIGGKIKKKMGKGRLLDEESLWQQLQRYFARLRMHLRTMWILKRHRDSVAASLLMIERRCRGHRTLGRGEGETVREFLSRLALAEGLQQEEQEAVLLLADATDTAFYSSTANLLMPFPQHRLITEICKSRIFGKRA